MKDKLTIGILIVITIFSVWIGISEAAINDISGSIVRLHILANSDSQEDQTLKLQVRDRMIKEMNNIEDTKTIDLNYITANKDRILNICKNEIKTRGYAYDVHLETGNFYFPTKKYKSISLPAGNYNAVRILIGSGKGQNWWCVMYPPLCFTSETKGELKKKELEELKESMSKEHFDLISGEESDKIVLRPSFKIVEIWQKFRHKIQLDVHA